jgi:hypothetical protein
MGTESLAHTETRFPDRASCSESLYWQLQTSITAGFKTWLTTFPDDGTCSSETCCSDIANVCWCKKKGNFYQMHGLGHFAITLPGFWVSARKGPAVATCTTPPTPCIVNGSFFFFHSNAVLVSALNRLWELDFAERRRFSYDSANVGVSIFKLTLGLVMSTHTHCLLSHLC